MSDSSRVPFIGQAERFRHEVERLLDRVKDQGEKALDSFGVFQSNGLAAPADLIETADGVEVTVDVPGVSGDTLDVQITGNMLTISGSRPEPQAQTGAIVHSRKRQFGEFSMSLPMPVPVNHDYIEAEICDGVLTVKLAKAEAAKARTIPIAKKSRSMDEGQ